MKLIVKRAISRRTQPTAKELIEPVLKLLLKFIETDGEIFPDNSTPLPHRSWLRLTAGLSLLKLARTPLYETSLGTSNFYKLALLIQDPVFEVRNAVVAKLCKYLADQHLHFRYLTVLPMTAHDPDKEIRERVSCFFEVDVCLRVGFANDHFVSFL